MDYLIPIGATWALCGLVNAVATERAFSNIIGTWFKVKMANATTAQEREQIRLKSEQQSGLLMVGIPTAFCLGPIGTLYLYLGGMWALWSGASPHFNLELESEKKTKTE